MAALLDVMASTPSSNAVTRPQQLLRSSQKSSADVQRTPRCIALNSYGIFVLDVLPRVAERAGALLEAIKSGSELAIEAFVVAAADVAGDGLIATVDTDDLARLAAHARPPVHVVLIQPSSR